MRRAAFSEWMVRRFTTKTKAAALVGDLLEIGASRGDLWFWRSLAGVLIRLAWRPVVGFIAALYAGAWVVSVFSRALWGVRSHHPPSAIWLLFAVLPGLGDALVSVLVYSAIRFGVRNRVTQLTACAFVVTAGIALGWWNVAVLATTAAFAAVSLAASLATASRRRASLIALITVSTGIVVGFLALNLASSYQNWIIHGYQIRVSHVPVGDAETRVHPSIECCIALMYFLTIGSMTAVIPKVPK